ncbi:MAG: Eco57I restriction-modification methylase domain-containing protein, partial [Bacillota bacterium]
MKKTLSEIKSALMEKYTDSEVVFGKYMDKVFELFEDEFQVSEAFYYFNKDKRVSINKNKQNRKRVAADEAHIATQFFTPKWLVQYVSDNSLGRFLKGAPLRFFHGDTNTIRQKDDIKILDPAVGTGNMLIYAYELLENYYRTKGMAEDKIPPKILSCFYGLDIDKKAVDVAKRLLMRKAGVEKFDFHIYHFESVSPILLQKVRDLKLKKLLGLFEHWNKYKEAGSLIKIEEDLTKELKLLKKHIHSSEEKNIIEIINILSQKYDVTLMNPPYLSSSDFSFNLKEYIYQNYNDYKADLFSCFIKRGLKLMKENGYMGVVCPYNWMFIKTFSQLRKYIIENKGLYNLMQLNCGGYDKAVVYLSAFVVGDKKPTDGYYIRLSDFKAKNQKEMALRAIDNPPYVYKKNQDVFLKTPNYAIIYWTSESFLNNFHYKKLSDYLEIRQGMATGDNKRFLSKVEKVDKNKICFHAKSLEDFDKSNKIYAPYNKGGKYRKWWGNRDYVIKFDKASREVLSCQGN